MFLLIIAFILSPSPSPGDDPWVLLVEGDKEKYRILYNKKSIQKIKENVLEVYDVTAKPQGNTYRQLRIDCSTGQYAIGKSESYEKGARSPYRTFDLSNAGWMWFDPTSTAEKRLIHIVCKKEK